MTKSGWRRVSRRRSGRKRGGSLLVGPQVGGKARKVELLQHLVLRIRRRGDLAGVGSSQEFELHPGSQRPIFKTVDLVLWCQTT